MTQQVRAMCCSADHSIDVLKDAANCKGNGDGSDAGSVAGVGPMGYWIGGPQNPCGDTSHTAAQNVVEEIERQKSNVGYFMFGLAALQILRLAAGHVVRSPNK